MLVRTCQIYLEIKQTFDLFECQKNQSIRIITVDILRPSHGRGSWAPASRHICVDGWGGRIRTSEWRYQKPLPYHLATPQCAAF